MQVTLVKTFAFEAAHWLPTFPDGHKCRRLHGHSFSVDVHVLGEVAPAAGYLIDYGEMQAAIEPVRRELDHYCLNEIAGLENPTSENLARWIWERLRIRLPQITMVVVRETCSSRCEYRGD